MEPIADLARERQSSTLFPTALMKQFLDGGEEASKRRELAYLMISRDPILSYDTGHPFDMTTQELREKTMAQIRRVQEVKKGIRDPLLSKSLLNAMAELSDSFAMRIGVHEILFKTAMNFFAAEDQKGDILRQLEEYEVIGCFAMTEMGHSSSLRDLETTATLDLTTDEWHKRTSTVNMSASTGSWFHFATATDVFFQA
ncbi:fatty-acyl coenzyme A oxidase [Phlyctochytrium bullatum]|nr:fatty-acyl coenzyme A oxidase [Phlyctochytrium bullatum]